MNETVKQLIPEWRPTEAVVLAWPDNTTDWAPWLSEVEATYVALIGKINLAGAGVILLCKPSTIAVAKQLIPEHAQVVIVAADYNDTWVRDYAFLTCRDKSGANQPVEFSFNGWGQKFTANKDDAVNQLYLAPLCQKPMQSYSVVAEGGALEVDQDGVLLSTASCLLNPKRNSRFSLDDYHRQFTEALGVKDFVVLNHGHLIGDDTDGHIDTLVRFTNNRGLVIQACENRPDDPHYEGLTELKKECGEKFPTHEQFTLPLPCIQNPSGERLPASYANYLICNGHILFPIYQVDEDKAALQVIKTAYPNYQIIPVDCSALIKQFGSLHCITMQVPVGTLKSEIVSFFKQGVSRYAPQ